MRDIRFHLYAEGPEEGDGTDVSVNVASKGSLTELHTS